METAATSVQRGVWLGGGAAAIAIVVAGVLVWRQPSMPSRVPVEPPAPAQIAAIPPAPAPLSPAAIPAPAKPTAIPAPAQPAAIPTPAQRVVVPAPAPAKPAANPAAPAPAEAAAPSFDIVRVDPDGKAVIAGRAMPGARVIVLDNGKVLGQVTADGRGEWVLVPDAALPPGDRRLSLQAVDPRTGARHDSAATVAVEVAPPAAPAPAVALLVPNNGAAPAAVLQPPGGALAAGRLSIASAETDGHNIAVAGNAAPGAAVTVTAGGRVLGTVIADPQGRWSLEAPFAVSGPVEIAAATPAAGGAPGQRIAEAFAPPPSATAIPSAGHYVVRRGNNLWWLARRTYGDGLRYTVIYAANRRHIRNPDLIYPGQVFVIPRS